MSSESLPGRLLDDAALEASAVVANCDMNRERQLSGVNSYARELGFSPLDILVATLDDTARSGQATVAWLDLCCGTGRALIQTATTLRQAVPRGQVALIGIDLAGLFDEVPASTADDLELVCASAVTWVPEREFDLITCVHGLHYIGDKLGLLTRAASWLTRTGQLTADLDLASIRLPDGRPAGPRLAARLRAAGVSYDSRRRRVSCSGRREIRLPYEYLGADDRAGPNYTGQPAVHSYYAETMADRNA